MGLGPGPSGLQRQAFAAALGREDDYVHFIPYLQRLWRQNLHLAVGSHRGAKMYCSASVSLTLRAVRPITITSSAS